MIVPIPPWESDPSFDDDGRAPHPLLEPELPLPDLPLSEAVSSSSLSRPSANPAEQVSIATALLMPQRLSARPPTSISGPTTPIPTYTGYEHGAPLSDIYEESEATPRSGAFRSRSASPTPVPEQPPTPTRPQLRHKKRISELSSSSGGSDVGDWENFDSSKVLTSRVAADLAQMKRDDMLEVDEQTSRRQSREEEELAALNAKAEKILANARKRLTNMEDNLKTARNSVLVPRSPQIGDSHQPVGGLYRSISAAGATKLAKQRQGFPSIRTSTSLQHMRGSSETGVPSPSSRYSRLPDVRSASALEYGSPARYSLFPEPKQGAAAKYQPSPASNKSYNSPLRPLEEEEHSPSTAQTTPESVKVPPMRGLGILTSAAISRENLAMHPDRSSSRQTSTPTAGFRPGSAASTRSAKDLKDQMTDLKTRIADLRSKAQADNLRRRSLQGSRGPSPFMATPNQAEQWYASSPTYDNDSPISTRGGIGWRNSDSPTGLQVGAYDSEKDDHPITPANARYLDVSHMTPGTEAHMLSSARTDRNTPSLARKRDVLDENEEPEDDAGSVVQASHYDDAQDDLGVPDEDDESDRIAENEEEQVYLNEVLEESLRDAEVEPEVPMIPGSFLPSPDGVLLGSEPERHEDRLDAFDYENMFLHSAMGTYTGKSLNGSESGSEVDSDDDGSVETSRAGGRTPVDDFAPDTELQTDEETEQIVGDGKSSKFHQQTTAQGEQPSQHPKQLRTPPQIALPPPPPPPPALIHARSKSMESISTAATFETATEGGDYDDTPNEILNWGPTPSSSIGYSPNSYQAYRASETRPPARHRHGFSSPQGGGRSTPTTARQASTSMNSPLRQQFVATEAINYINDNGVPERFQNQPSPHHSSYLPSHRRDDSTASVEHNLRPSSQATIKYNSPLRNGPPATPDGRTSRSTIEGSSPPVMTAKSSPQRKTVINRSLQHPESYVAEPYYAPPPSVPLPAPPTLPSSAALQAQMASPKKSALKQSPGRPTSAQKKTTPTQTSQRTPPMQDPASSPPTAIPVPNTEILMESLIKLANPSFSLAPGIRFNEVDKGLVLDLLSAVGGVCNEILTAGGRGGDPEETVERLRRRLEGANHILQGYGDGARSSGERTMREI